MYSGGPFPYAAFVLPTTYITNKLVVISEKPYRLYNTNKLWHLRSYFGRLAVFGFHFVAVVAAKWFPGERLTAFVLPTTYITDKFVVILEKTYRLYNTNNLYYRHNGT